jgi:hypothetical protein
MCCCKTQMDYQLRREQFLLPVLEDVGDEIDDDGKVVVLLGGKIEPTDKRVAFGQN